MLPSTNIQSIVGATLFGADDKKIGRITRVFVDAADGHPTFAEVHTGFLGRAVRHVPLDDARWENDDVFVDFAEDDVKHSPHHDGAEGLSPEQEADLRRHYFPSAGAAGGAAVAAGAASASDSRDRSDDEVADAPRHSVRDEHSLDADERDDRSRDTADPGDRRDDVSDRADRDLTSDRSGASELDAQRVVLGEQVPGVRARNAVAPGSYTDRDDAEVLDAAAADRREHADRHDADDDHGHVEHRDGEHLDADRRGDGDLDHDRDHDGLGRGDGGSVGVAGDPLHERDRRVRDDLDAVATEPASAPASAPAADGSVPEPPPRHAAPPTGDIPRI
jgi:hypothetical protein